jgi:hypothetical protein
MDVFRKQFTPSESVSNNVYCTRERGWILADYRKQHAENVVDERAAPRYR